MTLKSDIMMRAKKTAGTVNADINDSRRPIAEVDAPQISLTTKGRQRDLRTPSRDVIFRASLSRLMFMINLTWPFDSNSLACRARVFL